jgi:hypothetical protein
MTKNIIKPKQIITMKKLFFTIFCGCLLCAASITANAQNSGTCGDNLY